jgi:predicted O-methyltransferase YrrM
MSTPLVTKVRLKVKQIARDLHAGHREFQRIWPLIDAVEGWLLPSEGAWLFHAARSLPRSADIVEIGSFKGRSTCCLALGCRESQKRVFAIDSFDGGPDLPRADSFAEFSRNLVRLGLSSRVEPVVGRSSEAARHWEKPIHLLFIDGSHSYEDALGDFHGFFRHVVPGGLVAFHDVNDKWPGVSKTWLEVKDQLSGIGYCDSLAYGRKPKLPFRLVKRTELKHDVSD